jgi:hypothetical protein
MVVGEASPISAASRILVQPLMSINSWISSNSMLGVLFSFFILNTSQEFFKSGLETFLTSFYIGVHVTTDQKPLVSPGEPQSPSPPVGERSNLPEETSARQPFERSGSRLILQPITYREACAFILAHHRHHGAPQGWLFGVAVSRGLDIVGVAVVGRPVSRHLDNGWTAEVTRCCTDGTKNVPSMLYGACWRAAQALGYRRLITYILKSESGTSLLASGWKVIGERGGGSWHRPSRPRIDTAPIEGKMLWEAAHA